MFYSAIAATSEETKFVIHEAIIEQIIEVCPNLPSIDSTKLLQILAEWDGLIKKDRSVLGVWDATTRRAKYAYKMDPIGFCKSKLYDVVNSPYKFQHPFVDLVN